MSSFPLQPNPPSISHTNTSTHIHAFPPCLCCFPFSSNPVSSFLQFLLVRLTSPPSLPVPFFFFSPPYFPFSLPPWGVSQGAWLIQQLFVWSAVDRAHGYLGAQGRETERGTWGKGKEGKWWLWCSSRCENSERGSRGCHKKKQCVFTPSGGDFLGLGDTSADRTLDPKFLPHSTLELYKKSFKTGPTVKVTYCIPPQEKYNFYQCTGR